MFADFVKTETRGHAPSHNIVHFCVRELGQSLRDELGGRHLQHVLVEELATERGLRHRERGMQQAYIPDPIDAAVRVDQAPMQPKRVVDVQEPGL